MVLNQAQDDTRRIILQIDDIDYSVSVSFGFDDLMVLSKAIDCEEVNYCLGIAEIIFNKIECEEIVKPSVENILSNNEQVIFSYIEAVLQDNQMIKVNFDKHANECDTCRRFVMAIEDMLIDAIKVIKDGLLSNINPDALENMKKTMIMFVKETKEILENFSKELSSVIHQALAKTKTPGYSQKTKTKLLMIFGKWGTYGWTKIPSTSLRNFSNEPEDSKSANKAMTKHCNKKTMNALFDKILTDKRAKRTDVEEAIFCFNNKKYKACALILFALIEGRLIKGQIKEDINKSNNKRRPLGSTAFQNMAKRFKSSFKDGERVSTEQMYWVLSLEGLSKCIDSFFKNGNDFSIESPVLNRNFVSHGMTPQKVRKIDCIKLFLLYFNLLEFLEAYYGVMRGDVTFA